MFFKKVILNPGPEGMFLAQVYRSLGFVLLKYKFEAEIAEPYLAQPQVLRKVHIFSLGACQNTRYLEAVGKYADVKREWSKAHGTGHKEKKIPELMESINLSVCLSSCALCLLQVRRSDLPC